MPALLEATRARPFASFASVELEGLVRAAGGGDREAWDELVARFSGLVWATVRAHRLSASDSADVVQTTWLRLVEHLDRLREPERVGAWLATTARNECLRVIRRGAREVPVAESDELDAGRESGADLRLLTEERDVTLWRAFAALGERCQALLRLLIADPPPSYDEVSAALEMPIGSIGPTRMRCLEQLREHALRAGLAFEAGGAG
jgi:RNA polymerase sigma factor (sigma-70 family)